MSALFNTGTGEGNNFDDLRTRPSAAVKERELIAESDQILAGLQGEIGALVTDIQENSATAKDDAAEEASTGRMIMLIAGIVGVVEHSWLPEFLYSNSYRKGDHSALVLRQLSSN